MQKPVIFLAFANDRQNPGRFLKALEPERTALHRELSKYQEKGWGLYHSAGSSEPKELKKDLNQLSGKLVIFHFAGHANGTQLMLEGSQGESVKLSGSNLLAFLQEEPQLKLVFLNACATREHVQQLLEMGIPAVIATDTGIDDDEAKDFSEAFYSGLIQGKSLQAAFLGAKGVIQPGDREERIYRDIVTSWEEDKGPVNSYPWGLYVQEDDVLQWTLPKEPKKAKGLKIWQTILLACIIIGTIGGIVSFTRVGEILGLTPTAHSVTVLVHDEAGKDQLVLPNRGVVSLIYGDAKVRQQINDKGEAIFNQVPLSFFQHGSKVEVLFEDGDEKPEPYRAVYSDSLYSLTPGKHISLPVEMTGIGTISGIVKSLQTGELISGAKISIQGKTAISDELGFYELKIPKEKQRPFQTIRVFKEGFAPFELSNVPIQADQEIPIMLKPD